MCTLELRILFISSKNNSNKMSICKKISFLLFFTIFFCGTLTFSQKTEIKRYMVVRNSPKYTLQFNIDYNQSVLELSGAYNDDYQSRSVYDGETFGADKGYGGSVISKIVLNERGSFRFTQSLTL